MSDINQKFRFWCPVSISKAKDDDGNEVMRLGGIASTMDEDSDGEFLDPQGFDIDDFKTIGVVNWHHQAKNSPATIIGEPHKAEIRKDGFYVETDLYPSSPLAREVYELAQTMKRDSKNRRLGYSIEGSVIERESDNKTEPGYKKIKKAKITGLAITHMPKNPKTFADIIKGYVEEDLDEEKALDTDSGAALKRESVDGYTVKNMSEEKTYDKIFETFPGITIEKAEEVFNFLNKIKTYMSKGKQIKSEDLEKAMSHLGIESNNQNPFLEKAKTNDMPKKSKTMTAEEIAEATANKIESEEWGDDSEKEIEKNYMKKSNEDQLGGSLQKEILKAINESSIKQSNNAKALATLVKSQMDDLEFMKAKVDRSSNELRKAQAQLAEATELIKGLLEKPNERKSITKGYVQRNFEAQEKQIEKAQQNSNLLDATLNKGKILNILDQATFAKGFDEEFSKALTGFEAGSPLTDNVVSRLRNEFGVNIKQ
jgi:hypothetical protein